MYNPYKTVCVKGHYEVYYEGKFLCSADTKAEAEREIRDHESEVS